MTLGNVTNCKPCKCTIQIYYMVFKENFTLGTFIISPPTIMLEGHISFERWDP